MWRFILAFGIVFGLVIIGFVLIYSWIFLAPLALAGILLAVAWSRTNRKPAG